MNTSAQTTATARWQAASAAAREPGSRVLREWNASRAGVKNNALISSADSANMLDLFGVPQSASGMYVTPTSAMRVAAVFACVRIIAGALATLPLALYKRGAGGREKVTDTPLWWLLNERASANYSAAAHWEATAANILLRGDSFTYILRDARTNAVKALVPLPWDRVVPKKVKQADGSTRLQYAVWDEDRPYGVDQDDMLHFPGFGFDGEKSLSVISWAARNAAGTAMAMDEYSGRFFQNGAHPSIVLKSAGKLTEAQTNDLRNSFASKYSGVDNSHRLPLVLTEGLTAEKISLTAEDAQLLDARKFQVVDIARAFGVPPHMIGETSASTSWGSGIEQMGRAFVTYTLNPHLVRIEQELNFKFFLTAGRFTEFNRDALLEGDSKGQADYFRAALGGPGTGPAWLTVDEVRRLKNLPPLGGSAAEPYDPRIAAPAPSPTESQP